MKKKKGSSKISNIRFGVQILSLILAAFGFFTAFEITMTIILVATLLAGTFYCGWICPFGTIQESFARIGRGLGIKKRKMPQAIHQYLIYIRYIIFILVMFFSLDIIFQILSYDPRGNFGMLLKGNSLNIAAFLVILSFAVIGMFYDRPFCNYFCYEGAKYGLISSFRPVTIMRDPEKCVGCTKCDKACPMNIEVSKTDQVGSTQCINCFQCVEACPIEDTLTYGFIGFNAGTKKRFATTGLVAVIALGTFVTYSNLTGEGFYTYFEDDTEDAYAQEELATGTAIDTSAYTIGDAAGIADGTYTGSGEGFQGTITVDVTVVNEIIYSIEVTDYSDDDEWFERAEDSVPNDIIDAQTTDVSAVSGATYSSEGIMEAVADALANADSTGTSTESAASTTTEVAEAETEEDPAESHETPQESQQASPTEDSSTEASETELAETVTEETELVETVTEEAAPAEPETVAEETTPAETQTPVVEEVADVTDSGYTDGVYTGYGEGFRGITEVEVTVSGGAIASIEVIDYEDDTNWFERAWDTVVASILSDQSTDVSAVSGATYSSEGIMEAVADALKDAQ